MIHNHKTFIRGLLKYLHQEVKRKPVYEDIKLLGRIPGDEDNGFIIGMDNREICLYLYESKDNNNKVSFLNVRDMYRDRGHGSLIQYTIDQSNFIIAKDNYEIIQNRIITIGRKQDGLKADYERSQRKHGYNPTQPILKGKVKKPNYSENFRDLLKWLKVSLKAKQELEKKYVEKGRSEKRPSGVDNSESRRLFELWIWETHQKIRVPLKYSGVINTVSNALNVNLYKVTDPQKILLLRDRFFIKKGVPYSYGNYMYYRGCNLYFEYLSKLFTSENTEESEEIKKVIADKNLDAIQKKRILESRTGQGTYRKNLIELWKGCNISGYSNEKMLIASHIKPWKDCDNSEKIDRYNGLLLLPTLDGLFDKGYITFEDNGKIKISRYLPLHKFLNLSAKIKINLLPENLTYLKYHREHEFEKWMKNKLM